MTIEMMTKDAVATQEASDEIGAPDFSENIPEAAFGVLKEDGGAGQEPVRPPRKTKIEELKVPGLDSNAPFNVEEEGLIDPEETINDGNEEPAKEPDAEKKDVAEEGDSGDKADENNPAFDEAILKRSVALGLSEEESKRFPTQDLLDRALCTLEMKLGAQPQTPVVPPVVEATPEPAKPEAEAKPEETATPKDFKPFALSDMVDKEELDSSDPIVVQALEGITEKANEAIKGVFGQIEAMQGKFASMEAVEKMRLSDAFDKQINNLGESYLPVFGKGKRADVLTNEEFMKNRNTLVNAYNSIMKYSQGSLSSDEGFRRAVIAAFPEPATQEAKDTAQKDVEQKLRNNKGQFLSPNSQRSNGKTLTPDQQSIAVLRKAMGKSEAIDDDDDAFPDDWI